MDSVLRDQKVRVSIDSSEQSDANVVLQEYLEGEEWVVDTVSRAGEHKVLALWKYDKGEANGAPFVYFGIDAMGSAGLVQQQLMAYARKALDALGWRWGACHIEIKMVPKRQEEQASAQAAATKSAKQEAEADLTPVLVEINAGRWNGEEFKPLAELCNGYDAFEATLDAYLGDADEWDAVADSPPAELRVQGKNVKLVSYVEGTLTAPPAEAHAAALSELTSLLKFAPEDGVTGRQSYEAVGSHITKTVDLNTCAGYAYLVHPDARVIEEDYRALRALQPRLFQVD